MRIFYNKTDELRKDFATRGWETIKAYLLMSSIIIAVLSISPLWEEFQDQITQYFWIIPLLLTLVGMIFFLNFKRECERLYEQIGILIILEQDLGAFSEREIKNVFPEEKYYFPERAIPEDTNIENFIKRQMKKRWTFFGIYKYLFFVIPFLTWGVYIVIIILRIL